MAKDFFVPGLGMINDEEDRDFFIPGFGMLNGESGGGPPPEIPDPPGNVDAVSGDEENTISWDASEGATSYNIYWDTETGVTKETGTKIEGVTSPHVHSGLENDQPYYYVVTAENEAGESDESDEVSATPEAGGGGEAISSSMFLVF
jgi:hypothetical protein